MLPTAEAVTPPSACSAPRVTTRSAAQSPLQSGREMTACEGSLLAPGHGALLARETDGGALRAESATSRTGAQVSARGAPETCESVNKAPALCDTSYTRGEPPNHCHIKEAIIIRKLFL
ncbi:hypothetical protein NDU88_005151 [Pleurodeles waltl]|uniref:Uncharacterized protein n=1 Tax=Pleurodeles waltl TaxID=8319 RepID=A0AAV7V5L6_PLEWA|nr:hypothetical protein NDU88_005151 [Pleurodeles waltl]